MSQSSSPAYLTPTLAKILLEQIEAFAKANQLELPATSALPLIKQAATYDLSRRPGDGKVSYSSYPEEKVKEVSPLLAYLQGLNVVVGKDLTAAELLKQAGVLRADEQKAQALGEEYVPQVKALSSSPTDAINLAKSSSEAYELDLERLRDIAAGQNPSIEVHSGSTQEQKKDPGKAL